MKRNGWMKRMGTISASDNHFSDMLCVEIDIYTHFMDHVLLFLTSFIYLLSNSGSVNVMKTDMKV